MAEIIDIKDRMPGPSTEEEKLPLDMQSWRPEVVADAGGKWTPNGLCFATRDEAYRWAQDLSYRWILVSKYRAMPCSEPVNYRYDADGKLEPIK
jgi:hypothetical protein